MGKIVLNRDFTKFLEDETFPHRVEVHFGKKQLICSGMVLAQQSSIIEELIREDCGVLMFEKVENIGTVDQKVDCVKYMYGANLDLGLKNIDTTIKFASLYGVQDLFNKCIKWVGNSIVARNVFMFHEIPDAFESKAHKTRMNTIISEFITKNIDAVGLEIAERVTQGDKIDSDLFLSVMKQSPANGSTLLKEWAEKNDDNKNMILEKAHELDFTTLFPTQEEFTGFVAQLSAGSNSIDAMKQVLALQQDYFVKSAAKVQAVKASVSQQAATEPDQEVDEEESEDERESVASSVDTAGKPKSNRGGRKKHNRNEQWNAGKSGNKPTQPQHKPNNKPNTHPQPQNKPNQQRHARSIPDNPKQKIFIANIPMNATANEIKSPFMFCGPIVKIDVHSQKRIAFIEFNNEQSVRTILSAAKNGVKFTINGEMVSVNEFTAGKPKGQRAEAKAIIESCTADRGGGGGGFVSMPADAAPLEMWVESCRLGRVIGKGGSKIREIREQFSVRVDIKKDEIKDDDTMVIVTGSPASTEQAKEYIDELCERSSKP